MFMTTNFKIVLWTFLRWRSILHQVRANLNLNWKHLWIWIFSLFYTFVPYRSSNHFQLQTDLGFEITERRRLPLGYYNSLISISRNHLTSRKKYYAKNHFVTLGDSARKTTKKEFWIANRISFTWFISRFLYLSRISFKQYVYFTSNTS